MRRITRVSALAVLVLIGGCGTNGTEEGVVASSAVERTTTEPAPPSTTSTTEAATTTTIDSVALYREIDVEIQRACTEAVSSGRSAVPVFDERWSELSSPEELAATVGRCIDGQLAARRPTTTVAPIQPLTPQTTAPPVVPSTSYANCDAVRAAGAAPIYAGEPGYGSHLDRDGDGIGCE